MSKYLFVIGWTKEFPNKVELTKQYLYPNMDAGNISTIELEFGSCGDILSESTEKKVVMMAAKAEAFDQGYNAIDCTFYLIDEDDDVLNNIRWGSHDYTLNILI